MTIILGCRSATIWGNYCKSHGYEPVKYNEGAVDPRLSETQCVSDNGKSVQINQLFVKLKSIHLYPELC